MRLLAAAFRLTLAVALCAGAAFAAERGAARAQNPLPEPFDARAIDRHVNACTNFFDFATGGYRRSHPIPPAYTEYGYIEELEDSTRAIVRAILERAQRDPGGTGSNAEKIGRFYGTCMDTAAIERRGLGPLTSELQRIAGLRRATLAPEITHLHAIGVDATFALNPAQDLRYSTRVIGEIDQAGLGLPERDYYLRPDLESRRLRELYEQHVARMLALAGVRSAAASAADVMLLETALARASRPAAALREPEAIYHPMSPAALDAFAPHVAFARYLRSTGIRTKVALNVAEPEFVSAVNAALVDVPVPVWQRYFRWRLLDTYARALPARFARENFDFRERILNGVKEPLPRWKQCVNATDAELGEAVGQVYVARVFPRQAKQRALALTVRVKAAFSHEMAALSWMSATTRRIALAKLSAMGLKVGYPARWRDYSGYAVGTDAYVGNVERGAMFERRFQLAKIDRPLDRTEWSMTPQTVNAYNDIQRNEIVLPAAQLQRPFFDPRVDDAANLGATGAGTIGHEMTHGFDDEGHKFDAAGNLRNWWTSADLASFDRRAQCVIRQFDATTAVGNVHYTGRLVSGEAIADLGGVVIGYRALQEAPVPKRRARNGGFTREQRYFLSFAQSWTENIRPEAARTQALSDPHPLPRDRVNATVANVPAWYAAFGCPPPRRPVCTIW